MIEKINNGFILNTDNTSYCFAVNDTGHLIHLHYGRRVHPDFDVLCDKSVFAPGNSVVYNQNHKNLSLETALLEISSLGKGDIREPFIEIVHADGSFTSDFKYKDYTITKGKEAFLKLPGSYDENDEVDHLTVILEDAAESILLELHYYVYEKCDVITRSARLLNNTESDIVLKRLMSLQLDFDESDFEFTTFNGAWIREMNKNSVRLVPGRHVNSSFTGTSSNRANPFTMLSRMGCTEDAGDVFAFNLIYSGNHYECCDVNSYNMTRFVSGINPQCFSFVIKRDESFEAPEAVMTFSKEGFGGMSRNMHNFVREHIVRGVYKKKDRPILINSWEASYFDINERKLLKLAKAAKEVGIELFVMDDGWFGERNDDTSSLGDWNENLRKLPGKVAGLASKINEIGLDFGIWVEPEMVNVNSTLYKLHPEWAIDIPGREHSEGRNQRLLDLTREDVREYLIEEMSRVFTTANISYVKWDMNRIFSDVYSKALGPECQGEVLHRYVLGLYKVLGELVKRFPDILFEGCSSGGNRFDLGILCYCPQIWASDNTDALCRVGIQESYSYGYPQSTYTAHVSSVPNHQTLRVSPLESRFNVAAFGILGYEFNLCDLSNEDRALIAEQIKDYKRIRHIMQFGDFYRVKNDGNAVQWTVVDESGEHAVGMCFTARNVQNSRAEVLFAKGLNADLRYRLCNRVVPVNVKVFGDLVNMLTPIHIKQNSHMHDIIAHFAKMESEKDDIFVYGDTLMNGGYRLHQNFNGCGYEAGMMVCRDFGSQMYFIDKEEK